MALPSASEVPTTSPSHGSTSGGHVESYEAYLRKRYVLYHPRLHHPLKPYHRFSTHSWHTHSVCTDGTWDEPCVCNEHA